MVDIIPSSQLVIGHGAFSVVYRARLKTVSGFLILLSIYVFKLFWINKNTFISAQICG
jgi:uncharacterized SAM-binding protein YcdF (DUF218 family)